MNARVILLLVLAALPAAAATTDAPLPAGTLDAAPAPAPAPACDAAPAWDALVGDALPGLDFGDGEEDAHACWGKIQPGARMIAPAGCTMNWIVRDAEGAFYIGSAGHCAAVGRTVSLNGVGPIGTVVYNGFPALDFLLVKIDPAVYDRIDPTLCHWGGPIASGVAPIGEGLLVYGFGSIYGSTGPSRARVGVAQSNNVRDLTYVGTMQPGDSGAPVMTDDGVAVGVHVRSFASVPGTSVRVDPSPKFATRADVAFAAAGAALGTTIALVPSAEPVNLLATI